MFGDDRRMEVSRRLDEVAGALSDLGEALAREEDLGPVSQRSVSQVAAAIPAADMVSVTVLRGSNAETVASTSERVWAIDSDQYAAGDGPCLEAADMLVLPSGHPRLPAARNRAIGGSRPGQPRD